MGKYSSENSDDDRRRSRRERNGRRHRSRSRSRSRERRHRNYSRRHRSRSRSQERRRSRSRDRRRERSSDRSRRYRSSSKSRRGQKSRSQSSSRGRSHRRRSYSSSVDRDRRKDRGFSSSSRSSSTSRISARKEKLGKEDENRITIHEPTSYIPSAETLAKIESEGFVSEAFVSSKWKDNETDDSRNLQEKSHENAIFGGRGSAPFTNITQTSTNDTRPQLPGKDNGVMSSLLHEREDVKNDRWMKKLQSMRQKMLNS